MSRTINISELIPPNFDDLMGDVLDHKHTYYILKGGRGSCKSSFVSIAIILMMIRPENSDKNCIVFRKTANTLRDSVFAQLQFAIIKTGTAADWRCTINPMKMVYVPTGQEILFRGVDDKMKIKSLKAPHGYFAFAWLEECDSFAGMEEIRNVLQSSMRGGDKYWTFMSFNPPISNTNFMNVEAAYERPDRIVHSSDYRTVPIEWLGESFVNDAEHLKETNERAYKHEYLGEAVGTGTNIFEQLEIREITDEEIQRYERIYQGQDWGWYPDPKAFIRAAYVPNKEKVVLLDELGGCKIRVSEMANIIKEHGYDDYTIYCGVDEEESKIDFVDNGLPARSAIVTPGSRKYTFEWLQCRTLVIDPKRTPKAYKEIIEYEHELDSKGEVIADYPDGNDHYIDALRYAFSPLAMRRGNSA